MEEVIPLEATFESVGGEKHFAFNHYCSLVNWYCFMIYYPYPIAGWLTGSLDSNSEAINSNYVTVAAKAHLFIKQETDYSATIVVIIEAIAKVLTVMH